MVQLYEDSDFVFLWSSQFDPTLEELKVLTEEESKDYLKKKDLEHGRIQKGHQKTQEK